MQTPKKDWINLEFIGGAAGREDFQERWQTYTGLLFTGKSILDVGAGLGQSKHRLAVNGNTVTLQDPAPGLAVDLACSVDRIPDRSYDVVTAFDVIEHIEKDEEFTAHLYRIARECIVLATPNYNVSKASNPHHVREYTPEEFIDLMGRHRRMRYFVRPHASQHLPALQNILEISSPELVNYPHGCHAILAYV